MLNKLDKLKVAPPCLIVASKMKEWYFENIPEHLIANIVYISEKLGDCCVYHDVTPMENLTQGNILEL